MQNPNLDISSLTISSGENLPHWQCNHAIYHITFRLSDSVPQSVQKKWLREREILIEYATQNNELTEEIEKRAQYLYSDRIEKFLDSGFGECYLSNSEVAQVVVDALIHFNHIRYHLHAWCIMPNHVHIIVEVIVNHDLAEIIHSWKSFTAHIANKKLGLKGSFWQPDAYNHIIRSKKEYDFQVKYVWDNPTNAGLYNWQWRWKVECEE